MILRKFRSNILQVSIPTGSIKIKLFPVVPSKTIVSIPTGSIKISIPNLSLK